MNVKQVIVIRRDLKMRRGKEIAQGAHASQQWILDKLVITKGSDGLEPLYEYGRLSEEEYWWITNGTKKVTVKVDSEEDLIKLHSLALEANLTSHIIVDEGLTEFNGVHTITALAIGPNDSDKIDKITGNLVLY